MSRDFGAETMLNILD